MAPLRDDLKRSGSQHLPVLLQMVLLSCLLGLNLQASQQVPEPKADFTVPALSLFTIGNSYIPEGAVPDSASFYHSKFNGRQMANLKRYDEKKVMTAACRKDVAELGDTLRVTRTDTGRSITVVCEDRMGENDPEGRAVDFSRAGARKMRMLRAGVVPVRVKKLGL